MYHNLKGDVFRIILKGLLISKNYRSCSRLYKRFISKVGHVELETLEICVSNIISPFYRDLKNSMVRSVLNHQDCDEVLLQDILHKEPGDHSHCGGQTGSTNPIPLQCLLVDVCSHYEGRCTLKHTHTHTQLDQITVSYPSDIWQK